MAYQNFKANIWAKAIEKDLEKAHVFVTDCNKEYEGQVKGLGDSVTIKGAGQVTMRAGADGVQPAFTTPEQVEGGNSILTIKHWVDFNFMVGDIDKEQGAGGAISTYTQQAAYKIADAHDMLVAGLAADTMAVKHSASAVLMDKTNVLEEIDKSIQMLWENNVPSTEKLTLTVSPRFYMLMKQNYMALDTDNSEMIKRGAVAMYGNVDVKLSNNVKTANSGAEDLIMLRTNKAIAFANPLTKTEAYRPDAYMADAVRGVSLFDAKIIKPKEMIILNAKYA